MGTRKRILLYVARRFFAPTTLAKRRALSLLATLPLLAGAQGNLKYATAGVTGVTRNFLAVEDGNSPTQFILPSSGGCGSGFALASASAGLAFPLSLGAGTVQTGVADNNVTAGDILIGGTVQAGSVRDSATTSRSSITNTTCVVGVALTSAAQGSAVTLLYDGVASYGTSGLVTSGSISANGPISANGAGVASSPSNTYGTCGACSYPTGSGSCTLTFSGFGSTIAAIGTVLVTGGGISSGTAISITNNGSGYTSNPSTATLSGSSCSGTPDVNTVLTPGCLHMQDGLGNDTGICAPPSGASLLWNLPAAGAPAANYLVSVDGSNNLTWTFPAPWTGSPPSTTGSTCGTVTMAGASSVGTIIGSAASCTVKLTFTNPATHGWSCSANDQTNPGAPFRQTTASAAAYATLTGTVISGDTITYMCLPY